MSKQLDAGHSKSSQKLSLAQVQHKTFFRFREPYITIDNDGIVIIMMMMTMFLLTRVILMITTSLCRLTWHGEPVQLLCAFVPVLTRQRYELAPTNDPHLSMEQNTNRIYLHVYHTAERNTQSYSQSLKNMILFHEGQQPLISNRSGDEFLTAAAASCSCYNEQLVRWLSGEKSDGFGFPAELRDLSLCVLTAKVQTHYI